MPLESLNIIWVIATLVGFIGYVASQVACIIFAFDAEGKVKPKALIVTALFIVASLLLLILGLAFA
ncbi:MAG: hypothetical protein HZRFUVUK_002016 [Candidatus Fervidibacterota bacterium]|jgi:hypothetical protein